MKEIKRVAAGVRLGNTADGIIVADIVDFDGGDYDLQPRISDDSLVLVDPNRPTAYGIRITGTPEALGRVGRALLTLERKAKSDGDDGDSDSTEE